MNAIEVINDPEVGELRFIRDEEVIRQRVTDSSPLSECCGDCDCADPGTGSDSCTCEDS